MSNNVDSSSDNWGSNDAGEQRQYDGPPDAEPQGVIESNWQEIVELFDDMNLRDDLLRGIYAYGFEKPSAIQQRAIMPCIKGNNYETALALLKDRFGDEQKIVTRHMDALLKLRKVDSCNVRALRKLYDDVELHIRGLESVGRKTNSYGELFIPVLEKIPETIRLHIFSKLSDKKWHLLDIMNELKHEVTIREKCEGVSIKSYKPEMKREPPKSFTASALTAEARYHPKCVYCERDHPSNKCDVYSTVSERKEFIRKTGRCYLCLRRSRLAANCTSNWVCKNCKGNHHISICTKLKNMELHSCKKQEPGATATGNNQSATCECDKPKRDVNQMHANVESLTILLQTARTYVYKPEDPRKKVKVRILLDSGSQRSYITSSLKDKLNLIVHDTNNVKINAFGNTGVQQIVERTELSIQLLNKEEEDLKVSVFVVPHICESVKDQNIVKTKRNHDHLCNLKLADYCYDNDLSVDILLGSDFYWNIVTGQVKKGKDGPVAINTKLGWVLSGPGSSRDFN
ncbi:Uncharacterised protein g5510 [Pycnogonum litorale]